MAKRGKGEKGENKLRTFLCPFALFILSVSPFFHFPFYPFFFPFLLDDSLLP